MIDRVPGLSRALSRALDLERNLTRVCHDNAHWTSNAALEDALECARAISSGLDMVYDELGERDDIEQILTGIHELTRDVCHKVSRIVRCSANEHRDDDITSDLIHVIKLAQRLDGYLGRVLESLEVPLATDPTRSTPGRVQSEVVVLATYVLPVLERQRYREEFRAELIELPPLEQLRYALRVFARAWELRRALPDALIPAGTPARRTER